MSILITTFTKIGGPLTKRISLASDGSINADGSACVMAYGVAQRTRLGGVGDLAELLDQLRFDQAIALGRIRGGLPEKVEVTTKARLNGAAAPNLIARTSNDIVYRAGQQALALLDYDTKGMPREIADKLDQLGGFWPALVSVLPALRAVARVTRPSTSSGLYRSDTGEQLAGSDGVHVYIAVRDGTDIERSLRALHVRCWLAGLGWLMVGAAGQLLERSIIDRMVGAPERLVFEGGPILEPPLRQKARRPAVVEGEVLDTAAVCPQPTVAEMARLRELKEKQGHLLAPDAAKARSAFIHRQTKHLVERTGISEHAARQLVARQCEGVLLPDLVLPFDDEEFGGCTVRDVLANPEKFEGATLADPVEGIDYGRCKAKVMRRADGTPWIHSFAHGRTVYDLKFDARAIRVLMRNTPDDAVVRTFVKLAMMADLDEGELEELRNQAAKRGRLGLNTVKTMLRDAEEKKTEDQREQLRRFSLAERRDPRPQIRVPADDAPWLPQMDVLNDVIGKSTAARPPMRDVEGIMTRAAKLSIPGLHVFTADDANRQEESK
jgi:hypothetical protein